MSRNPEYPPSYDEKNPQNSAPCMEFEHPDPGLFGGPTPITTPPTNVIITHQTPGINLGSEPVRLTCPHCNELIMTKTLSVPNTKTHLMALLLCCCVCWPCAWVPYCMDSCQSQKHVCSKCDTYIGTFKN